MRLRQNLLRLDDRVFGAGRGRRHMQKWALGLFVTGVVLYAIGGVLLMF